MFDINTSSRCLIRIFRENIYALTITLLFLSIAKILLFDSNINNIHILLFIKCIYNTQFPPQIFYYQATDIQIIVYFMYYINY